MHCLRDCLGAYKSLRHNICICSVSCVGFRSASHSASHPDLVFCDLRRLIRDCVGWTPEAAEEAASVQGAPHPQNAQQQCSQPSDIDSASQCLRNFENFKSVFCLCIYVNCVNMIYGSCWRESRWHHRHNLILGCWVHCCRFALVISRWTFQVVRSDNPTFKLTHKHHNGNCVYVCCTNVCLFLRFTSYALYER